MPAIRFCAPARRSLASRSRSAAAVERACVGGRYGAQGSQIRVHPVGQGGGIPYPDVIVHLHAHNGNIHVLHKSIFHRQ